MGFKKDFEEVMEDINKKARSKFSPDDKVEVYIDIVDKPGSDLMSLLKKYNVSMSNQKSIGNGNFELTLVGKFSDLEKYLKDHYDNDDSSTDDMFAWAKKIK